MGPFDWSGIGNHAKTCAKARAARAARKAGRSTKAASEARRIHQELPGYQPWDQILTAEKVEEIVHRAMSEKGMEAIVSLEKQITENTVHMGQQLTQVTGEMKEQLSRIREEMKEQLGQIRGDVEKMVESKLREVEEIASRLARETRAPKQEQVEMQTGPKLPDIYPLEGQPERRQHRLEETAPRTVPAEESGDQARLEARGIGLLPGRPIRDNLRLLVDRERNGVALRTYRLRPLGPVRRRLLRGTGAD